MFLKSKIGLLVFCLVGVSFFSSIPGIAVRDFQVTVKPRRIDTRASYLLTLKLDLALEVHDWIKITWPKETKLPILPENPSEKKLELKRIIESIFIGTSPCSACQGYPEINYKENSIRFNIHMELNPNIHGYEEVNIMITDRVGIVNPQKAGMYELKIATAKEQNSIKSIPYEIVESRIGDPEGVPIVTVTPNGNHVKAAYQIEFNVGKGGSLVFNQSRIRIRFPHDIVLTKKPHEVEPYLIKINEKPVVNKIMIADQVITIISPINTVNSGKVTVYLDIGVGIVNPDLPGFYQISISTSEDSAWVESTPFEIIKNVETLSVEPNKAGREAIFKFQFLTNQNMDDIDPIYILFPDNMKVPMSIDKENIKINMENPSSISVDSNLVLLYTKKKLEKNSVLSIEFSSGCKIKNPSETCFLKLGYRIANQTQFLFTSEVLIEKTFFSIESIQIEPPNAMANASYSFDILIDAETGIPPDLTIYIDFPKGSLIPDTISSKNILINDTKPKEVKKISTYQLSLVIQSLLVFDSIVHIAFLKEAGISNPAQGNITVQFVIYCSLDPTIQTKKNIFLYPALPTTEILFREGQKGNNDWFIKAPIMDFQKNQEDCKTFFFWNGIEENILEFVEPMVLPDGQYQTTLSYYSESPFGMEDFKTISIKVDTVLPHLSITKPEPEIVKTNKTTLLIEGRSTLQDFSFMGETSKGFDKKLQIDNKLYIISKEDGFFSFLHPIEPRDATVLVRLEDEAGNSVSLQFNIYFKLQKPICIINEPKEHDWVINPTLLIKGQAEPGSIIKLSDRETKADESGYFQLEGTISEIGFQSIKLTVVDLFGNQAEYTVSIWFGFSIQMQINSLNAMNNNIKRKLDLAPFIREERTMVPFRFLGEELQAIISFEIDPVTKLVSTIQYELNGKTVQLTIGKKEGIVDGEIVLLDTFPVIMKGRTVVPLRFISENLGCKTVWEPTTKSILVQYAQKS